MRQPTHGACVTTHGLPLRDAPRGYDMFVNKLVAELLVEVGRMLGTGDYPAARTLFDFAARPDAEAMPPLRERVKSLGTSDA